MAVKSLAAVYPRPLEQPARCFFLQPDPAWFMVRKPSLAFIRDALYSMNKNHYKGNALPEIAALISCLKSTDGEESD